MSVSSLPSAPKLTRLFNLSPRKPSGPQAALEALLSRVRDRLYPETTPVLVSYWLKTVYTEGHNLVWWSELNAGIERALGEQRVDELAAESIASAQAWIRQQILNRHKAPEASPRLAPPFRPDLTPQQMAVCVSRFLNEWLPGEVARLLTTEMEHLQTDEGGMPALAVGKAVERLLQRERFSPQSLEQLLQPGLISAKHVYPAHLEILRDVVLALLGRASAPPAPVLPACLLAVASASALPQDFDAAVERAFVAWDGDREALYVPLPEAQALELLRRDPVRIGSTLVTMDGRWWASDSLQGGDESAVIYRPGGRLTIDFTSDHARLVAPWPETEASWPGDVHLPERVELFGREWRGRAWEREANRAWLHLEFTRVLTIQDAGGGANVRQGHLRPASSEMAWSEMEQALASCLARRSGAELDQLRREELIPLARAILRLAELLLRPSLHKREELERSLMSIRYLHGAVADVYGRIPSRVLPPRARDALRRTRLDARASALLHEVFEDSSGAWTGPAPHRAA